MSKREELQKHVSSLQLTANATAYRDYHCWRLEVTVPQVKTPDKVSIKRTWHSTLQEACMYLVRTYHDDGASLKEVTDAWERVARDISTSLVLGGFHKRSGE